MAIPGGSPVQWSRFGRAVQAYAWAIVRGKSLEEAQAAALVHDPEEPMPDIIQAARESVALADLIQTDPHLADQLYRASLPLVSEAGATTVVATVRVLFVDASGMEHWATVQPSVSVSAGLDVLQAEAERLAAQLATGSEFRYAGQMQGLTYETVIGHIPGNG